jgi:hypothetical protein
MTVISHFRDGQSGSPGILLFVRIARQRLTIVIVHAIPYV